MTKWRCDVNKRKLIEEVKQQFMLKRISAQEKADDFVAALRHNEEFDKLYSAYTKAQLEYLKSRYEEENLTLKYDMQELQGKINDYLKAHNINKADLKPKYDCPICNDTGVVGGKICKCLQQALNKKLSMTVCSQSKFKSFDDCNPNIMSETDKKTCEILKAWCKKYPNVSKINICLVGGAGTGKTFLLECVANEMLKLGNMVCYKTAFELNELARLYHIGKSYDFSDCLTADILLIDDLGTEPILKNVTKEYLYNLINTRQINNLPTFISTNLSQEKILDRYDERIYSRLANKSLSLNIQLTGSDKRLN